MSFPPPPLGSSGLPPPPLVRPKAAGAAPAALPPPPIAMAGAAVVPPPPAALPSGAGLPPPLAAGGALPAALPQPFNGALPPPPPLAALPQSIASPVSASALPVPSRVATPPPISATAVASPPPPLAVTATVGVRLPPPPAAARATPVKKPKSLELGVTLPPPLSVQSATSSLPVPSFESSNGGVPPVSPTSQKRAILLIQAYFRLYAAKKAYKKLYQERGWTLQAKSDRVLTSHVTKSRPTTPNRRRPTRGRRVQSKAQSVPDPERGPAGEGGAGVVVSETAKRALAQSTGQILFDPSKVTLRKTPTRSAEEPVARPGTAEVPRRARGMTAGPGSRIQKPARPMSMVLPNTISKPTSAGGAFPPPPSFDEDSADATAAPKSPKGLQPSASSPGPAPEKLKRRKTVSKVINNFLQKRPARDDLVEKGVLQPDEFQELAKQDLVTMNKDGSGIRPMAIKSATCMNIRCSKKLKKSAKHNCKKCGRAFCKSCMNKKAKIPELKYTKPVSMCDTCFLKQKAEAQAEAQARGP